MSEKRSSRDRFVETTAGLLHESGYHATGINQIIEKSGAPRGSLYFHFPQGKDQLVCEALKFSGDQVLRILDSIERGTPAANIVRHIFGAFKTILLESKLSKGCPIAVTALETGGDHPEIGRVIADVHQSWLKTISEHLAHEIKEAPRRKQMASNLLSLCEGALVQVQMARSIKPLDDAMKLALAIVKQ
ncbi:MAG: TetR/AcrR family transcriptional regulator [Leptospirales bacterium]